MFIDIQAPVRVLTERCSICTHTGGGGGGGLAALMERQMIWGVQEAAVAAVGLMMIAVLEAAGLATVAAATVAIGVALRSRVWQPWWHWL